tara:strand:- start:264 stop:533 length:270 start_codon:yes stop_codon:yes gene_type:complete
MRIFNYDIASRDARLRLPPWAMARIQKIEQEIESICLHILLSLERNYPAKRIPVAESSDLAEVLAQGRGDRGGDTLRTSPPPVYRDVSQ